MYSVKIDKNFTKIWERELKSQNKKYVSTSIKISKNEKFLAISSLDEIRVFNKNGNLLFKHKHKHKHKHKEWSSFNGSENCFSNDEHYFINILPFGSEKDDLLQIRKTETFNVIKEIIIPCEYSFYNFFNTRLNDEILIEAACGQDDCIIYSLSLNNLDNPEIEEWKECRDRIIGNLSKEEDMVITAPLRWSA